MLIGSIGAGKTTLSQALIDEIIRYKKTQSIEFGDYIIDTPGEYLDNRVYYNALIVTSAEKIFCVNAAEKKEIEELKRFLECN